YGNDDPGLKNVATIPAGSVAGLQTGGPVSAEVWFKTGYNASSSRYDYILEWVQEPGVPADPATEGRGMSIAVVDGKLAVYLNPWAEVATIQPKTWYHVIVAKESLQVRIYVNGAKIGRASCRERVWR